jgi:AcrR family transcriptional regulator
VSTLAETGDGRALRKGARTRQRLLELAIERFAADGYGRTSVAAVSRDAGLTPAAAYAYFPSKDALFRAAVDADAEGLIDEITAAEAGRPLGERLLTRVDHVAAGVERHPLARRVLAGLEPAVTGRLVTLPSLVALRERTAEEIAEAQRAGVVRPDLDPAAASLGIETVVLSLMMSLLQVGGLAADEIQARRAGVIALIEGALRAPG